MTSPVLFLNLDGVVQPNETPYYLLKGLQNPGPLPFSWAAPLQPVLERWNASVVLRSTATTVHGYEPIKGLAPDWLRSRMVGATSDVVRFISIFEMRKVNTRWGVIRRYVQEHDLKHWVALDDSCNDWPDDSDIRKHLVECDGSVGLNDPVVTNRLNLAFVECSP